jgi:hypothetical protein
MTLTAWFAIKAPALLAETKELLLERDNGEENKSDKLVTLLHNQF